MQPVRIAKNAKQRLLFQALRSRFFLLVAVLSALSPLVGSISWSYKAAHTDESGIHFYLVWAVVVLSWFLFLLTVAYQYWRLTKKKRNASAAS